MRDRKEVPSDTGPVNPFPVFFHAPVTTAENKWMDPALLAAKFSVHPPVAPQRGHLRRARMQLTVRIPSRPPHQCVTL